MDKKQSKLGVIERVKVYFIFVDDRDNTLHAQYRIEPNLFYEMTIEPLERGYNGK